MSLKPRWPLAAAIVIAAIAGIVRLWQARESLWLDELHTAWCAEGSLAEVAQRATIGNQSPLFFWFEWLLVRLFGPSEFSLRLSSIIAGGLLPIAMYWLAARWVSRGVGLLAGLLVTIDPESIFYGSEARPYALVELLAVVHVAITIELLTQPSRWLRVAWVLMGAALFYLHYTAALLIPAEILFFAVARTAWPTSVKYRGTALLIDTVLLCILCLPAISHVMSVYSRRANWAAFVPQSVWWAVFVWWPWALAAWCAVAMIAGDRSANGRHSLLAALVLCWLVVPPLVAYGLTTTDFARLFFRRYLLVSAPAIPIVVALAIELAPWRWAKLGVGLAIFTAAMATGGIGLQLARDGRLVAFRTEDWRAAAEWLNEQVETTQFPVLVYSGLIEADGLTAPHDELLEDYCLFPITSLYPLNVDRGDMFPLPMREPGIMSQAAEMLVVHRGGAWLIVRGGKRKAEAVAAHVTSQLQQPSATATSMSWQTRQSRSFGNVQILLLTNDAS
jgi:mannosyltransferase